MNLKKGKVEYMGKIGQWEKGNNVIITSKYKRKFKNPLILSILPLVCIYYVSCTDIVLLENTKCDLNNFQIGLKIFMQYKHILFAIIQLFMFVS